MKEVLSQYRPSPVWKSRPTHDDTGREDVGDKAGGVEGRERGSLGDLNDDGVTRGKGGSELPGEHEDGEVPCRTGEGRVLAYDLNGLGGVQRKAYRE